MTELRKRMIECLQLRGFSERTQKAYVRAVSHLAQHYNKKKLPTILSVDETGNQNFTKASDQINETLLARTVSRSKPFHAAIQTPRS